MHRITPWNDAVLGYVKGIDRLPYVKKSAPLGDMLEGIRSKLLTYLEILVSWFEIWISHEY